MEMVEWAIVGIVFAVTAALFWEDLAESIGDALEVIEEVLDTGNGRGRPEGPPGRPPR